MSRVVSIGYAKRTLEAGSREQERQLELVTGLEQHVMIVFTRIQDNLPERFESGNLLVLGTNTKTKVGMIWRAYQLGRAVLRANQSQQWVVSAQDPFETSVVAWPLSWSKNAGFHMQLHGDNFGNPAWRTSSFFNRVKYYFGLLMVRRAKRVRVVSERLKRSVVALGVDEKRVVVLPVKISLEKFLPAAATRRYTTESVRFLYAGRFSAEKQLDKLIAAFALLHDQNPYTSLTLLGEGTIAPQLQAQIASLQLSEAVTLRPWTNDIVSEYRSHDVFVLASAHEGYALVLLEAMATGMPVVSTDVGCVGEVMIPGEHGVVSESEPAAYAEALGKILMTEVREQYGRTAHRAVQMIADEYATYSSQWAKSFDLVTD